jgi:hypothetical protein
MVEAETHRLPAKTSKQQGVIGRPSIKRRNSLLAVRSSTMAMLMTLAILRVGFSTPGNKLP